MLYQPERHEPLRPFAWDETRAREAIARIAAEAERAFDVERLWPDHPLDGEPHARELHRCVYFGAAGVIFALDRLAEQGAIARVRDYAPLCEPLYTAAERVATGGRVPRHGYLLGSGGIALLGLRLTRAPIFAERVLAAALANQEHESNELLVGAPGTLLAAQLAFEETGDARLREAVVASADCVLARLERDAALDCVLWTQTYYGPPVRYLGLAHGFAGNACALLRAGDALGAERVRAFEREIARTLERTALRDGAFANWPPRAVPPPGGPARPLVQICHGAPGVIAALARLSPGSAKELEPLFVAGGELTWQAGPLVKGSNLCHGTAGNGYAFLSLHRLTGARVWLERARAFAMHALAQWEDERARHGRGRFSLWTGDPGLALYLWDCVRERDEFPTLHAF